jgi:hypothetical protein
MFRLRVAEAPVFVSVIGSGSGSSLNPNLLLCAGISTAVATIVAGFGIFLQLKVSVLIQRIKYLTDSPTFEIRTTVNPHSNGSDPSSVMMIVSLIHAVHRMVVRIMLMVPIYAISSLIALFSLEAAFVIDAIRDIYEVTISGLRSIGAYR